MSRLTVEDVKPIVDLVDKHIAMGARPPWLRGSGPSAVQEAGKEAIRLGLSSAQEDAHGFIQRRLDVARRVYGLEPSKSATVATEPTGDRHGHVTKPHGEALEVCVIPDIHVAPNIPNDRLLWIGRWCAHKAPDAIVQLGDWLTLDSVSAHHTQDSLTARLSPDFLGDIDSGRRSLELFYAGLGNDKAPVHVLFGNHEHRVKRFEERVPIANGAFTERLRGIFEERGIIISEFGAYLKMNGVGLIHHIVNTMGKPYGGKTSGHRAANDATFSIIHGHTHHYQSISAPKIDRERHPITILSAGCALPYGHVEDYVRHSTVGWQYGVLWVRLLDGVILDHEWTSMLTLEKRFKG